MSVLPVIGREMRAAARQPFTYHARLLAGAALVAGAAFVGVVRGFPSGSGGLLLSMLQRLLLLAIWILVPALAADCISRERREGTLGLLFLTPLRAGGLVLAKGFAHGLRALTLWLAVLPVLVIVFLEGGVSWLEAVFAATLSFSAICWALAAGLVASAWSRTSLGALLTSIAMALLCAYAWIQSFCAILYSCDLLPSWGWPPDLSQAASLLFSGQIADYLASSGVGFNRMWVIPAQTFAPQRVAPGAAPSTNSLLPVLAFEALVPFLVLALAIVLAGSKTRRSWREQPPSPRLVWWQRKFCTPVILVSLFRRWRGRKLKRNPVGGNRGLPALRCCLSICSPPIRRQSEGQSGKRSAEWSAPRNVQEIRKPITPILHPPSLH